ncbi:MAG: hypothetical protein ACI3ZP_01945 [Candidatus Cryptobacteroides sp.]
MKSDSGRRDTDNIYASAVADGDDRNAVIVKVVNTGKKDVKSPDITVTSPALSVSVFRIR